MVLHHPGPKTPRPFFRGGLSINSLHHHHPRTTIINLFILFFKKVCVCVWGENRQHTPGKEICLCP